MAMIAFFWAISLLLYAVYKFLSILPDPSWKNTRSKKPKYQHDGVYGIQKGQFFGFPITKIDRKWPVFSEL